MSETKHVDQARQRDLDFMRRFSEAMLMQGAKTMGIKVKIEPDVLATVPWPSGGSHEIVSHKVWMNSEGNDSAHMVAQMAYWSDAVPQEPPCVGGVSHGAVDFQVNAADSPAQRMSKEFEKAFHHSGFATMGHAFDNGFPQGFDEKYYKGHPAIATVYLRGSLSDLVRRAKSTELGRFIASDPALRTT